MSKPIHLDGTTLEGGGQLVRLALSLSALTKTAINITNIRGNRSGGGGLKSQHLTCVQWLGKASSARISGVGLKSKEITFTPSIPKYGSLTSNDISTMDWSDLRIQQNTPGSTNLVLQAILPYLLFSNIDNAAATTKIRLRITGGTNVSNSPSLEYLSQVLIPVLSKIGIPPIDITLHSRGWSHGSTRVGSVTYTITPLRTALPAFDLTERGDVTSVTATIIAPKDTEQRIRDELDVMFERREHRIFGARNPDISITFEDSRHESRYFLLLVATTTTGVKLGRDWLYDRGVRAGQVDKVVSCLVKTVGDAFIKEIEHGGCVDEFMRDQLVIFQALAKGRSRVYGGKRKDVLVEPSLHVRTAEWVANLMVGVEFDGAGGCEGMGFSPGESGEKTVVEGLEKLTVGES